METDLSSLLRFSDFFELHKSQGELDFVDIPLETDILLYVDPYCFKITNDPWFDECNDLIVDYFELILGKIRKGENQQCMRLFAHLHEPNDTRLGFSRGRPQGKAIGMRYAHELFRALSQSKAVKTGILRDISDCELFIPNVSNDRISDMTTNIIRGKLIDYTYKQCELHGVRTRKVASGMFWDGNAKTWRNQYVDLPVYNGQRILLVPKLATRYRLAIDHQYYYNYFVVEYLQAEHLRANTSLVEVLKNGRKRVTKKKIKEEYPLRNKQFLFEFTQQHPEVLNAYKQHVRKTAAEKTVTEFGLSDEEIELRQKECRQVDPKDLCTELDKIPPGRKDALRYHKHIIGMLTFIFSGSLRNPVKEVPIDDALKRIDISFTNRTRSGFFYALNQIHNVHCPKIFFECKNYSDDLGNPEFDQIVGRLNDKRGHFGVIVCRSIKDSKKVVQSCKTILNNKHDYVIVLEDRHIKHLVFLKSKKNIAGIDDYLEKKIEELIM
jgi:hypothetical protein